MKCTQEKCPLKGVIGEVELCTAHNCSHRTWPNKIVGRRVSAGKGEHQKFGTVVAAEPNRKDRYGNYPIEVQWDNGTRTQTMSFWVDWMKENV